MKVSVVICTYAMDRYDIFSECVDSVLSQTYDPLEVVIVVDGNDAVFDRVESDYGDLDDVVLHCNDENQGISYSRTRGAEIATGEVVAFIDDDAVAEPDWVETLVTTYEKTDAVAVGGYVAPDWVGEKPAYFPEEFYWLVGCTEMGFGDHMEEVRNTYGSNISYKRTVFLAVGGYDENTGRKGNRHVQAHEAPAGIRILEKYGKGMVYNENAVVNHKLFDYRGRFRWLVFRSFWQGYSKRVMDLLYPNAPDTKEEYLIWLLTTRIPVRFRECLRSRSSDHYKQLGTILIFIAVVGLGYVYALTKPDLLTDPNG